MPYAGTDFSPADPTEISVYSFDFTAALGIGETIGTAVWTIKAVVGTDATPANRLIGTSSTTGSVVSQKIGTLIQNVLYEVLCTITTSQNQTLNLYANVFCKPIP